MKGTWAEERVCASILRWEGAGFDHVIEQRAIGPTAPHQSAEKAGQIKQGFVAYLEDCDLNSNASRMWRTVFKQ